MSFLSSLHESKKAALAAKDPWLLRLERIKGKSWDDGIERISTQTIFDILEVLFDQLSGCRLVDVANDGDARIRRRVVLLEKALHVTQLRGLDVGVRSDDVAVIRMTLRKQLMEHHLVNDAVRLALADVSPGSCGKSAGTRSKREDLRREGFVTKCADMPETRLGRP